MGKSSESGTGLREFVPGAVWTVDQPFRFLGLEVGARMTLVRLASGDLWVHSPLRPDAATREAIDALGPVRTVIAPSRFHYKDLEPFRDHYAQARVYAPREVVKRMRTTSFAGVLGSAPEPDWAAEMDQTVVRGHRFLDEVIFCHRPSRTLIVTDLLMSVHRSNPPGARLFGRMVGIYERPAPPVEVRWTFRDRGAARETIERILSWDFDRIILSHGKVIPKDGKALLRSAYDFLWRK